MNDRRAHGRYSLTLPVHIRREGGQDEAIANMSRKWNGEKYK